jgi:hypothetical protein
VKIVVIAHRSQKVPPEEIAKHLPAEGKRALQFFAEDFVREIYSRKDGKGAVLIVEAESEAAARTKLAELPLVKLGLLDLDFYPVGPYRAIVAAANA